MDISDGPPESGAHPNESLAIGTINNHRAVWNGKRKTAQMQSSRPSLSLSGCALFFSECTCCFSCFWLTPQRINLVPVYLQDLLLWFFPLVSETTVLTHADDTIEPSGGNRNQVFLKRAFIWFYHCAANIAPTTGLQYRYYSIGWRIQEGWYDTYTTWRCCIRLSNP